VPIWVSQRTAQFFSNTSFSSLENGTGTKACQIAIEEKDDPRERENYPTRSHGRLSAGHATVTHDFFAYQNLGKGPMSLVRGFFGNRAPHFQSWIAPWPIQR
jgi:hypothetical protein